MDQYMGGRDWCNDGEDSAPEARDATGRSPDWCREGLRRPAVQYPVEHGLEEVD